VHPFSRSARRKASNSSVECPIVIIQSPREKTQNGTQSKINLKKVANFQMPKNAIHEPRFTTQLTTTSPQNHHTKSSLFRKTP
jgi:hypothetical protein